MKNYPLASSTWDKEEFEAIERVLKSGSYTMGENVKNFEIDFANHFNSNFSVMTNSGSSSNLLAVGSLFYTNKPRLKKGDEVIVPAISWPTSYYPLYQYGLKLIFVDVDLLTLNFDLDKLSEAINDKTKLIFSVNLLGNPNDYTQIREIIKNKDIILLEDNCESMGAKFNKRYTGTFGLMGTFSFFFSHHISTMEGGMILTDDEEIYHILLSLRSHGWTRGLPKGNRLQSRKLDPFSEKFQFVLPGYNLRPLEMSGAIGIEQLKKFPTFLKQRKRNAECFVECFKDNNNFIIQHEVGESSWFAFSLIISQNSTYSRKELINLFSKHKIECRPIVAGNFTKNKVLKYFDYEVYDKLDNSDYIDANGLYIGNHSYDLKDEITQLSKILRNN